MRKRPIFRPAYQIPHHNSLISESLETRLLLAGNIAASVSSGVLFLAGDDANNAVQVSTFTDPTYGLGFRVEGQENDGPTTVNGSAGAQEFFGVTHLDAQLFGGDDDFALTNNLDELISCITGEEPEESANAIFEAAQVPGWVVILAGDGENRVGVGPASIGQRLLIQGGRDGDLVGICDTSVGTNLVVQTFGGSDEVFIHNSSSHYATKVLTANGYSNVEINELYANDLIVRGGNHADDVLIQCVYIYDDLVVQTLAGDDDIQILECERRVPAANNAEEGCYVEYDNYVGDLLLIQTGDGWNYVEVVSVSAGQINVVGGIHGDEIEIEVVETTFDVRITTLDGDDIVDLDDLQIRSLIVSTGLGDDEVTVESEKCPNEFREDVIIRTDGGDDTVIIGPEFFLMTATFEENGNSHIGDDLIVETGDGTDYIDIFNYHIGDDAVINAGAGDDHSCRYGQPEGFSESSSEGGVYLSDLSIYGNLHMYLGDGADGASIYDVYVEGNAFLDAGPGDDGEENRMDALSAEECNLGIYINGLTVAKSLWLVLGTGNDSAWANNVYVYGDAFVNAGADDDHVSLNNFDVGNNLYVFMGGGDDELFIDGSSANIARLYGGAGNDGYFEGTNSFGSQFVYEFEYLVA